MTFAIHEIVVGTGKLALSPIPDQPADFTAIADWGATCVVSLTELHEGRTATFADHFAHWVHVPIGDFGVPDGDALDNVIAQTVAQVQQGGRILFHCKGGCGRSGMAVLRAMRCLGVEDALQVLRKVRPCAVETDAQMAWALRALPLD